MLMIRRQYGLLLKSSWTSSTSGIYGRFWALRGRTTWQIWRC